MKSLFLCLLIAIAVSFKSAVIAMDSASSEDITDRMRNIVKNRLTEAIANSNDPATSKLLELAVSVNFDNVKVQGNSNLRASAATQYANLMVYSGSSCASSTATAGSSVGVGVCYPSTSGLGSTMVTFSGTTLVITSYTDTACTIVGITSSLTTGTCSGTLLVNVASSITYPVSGFMGVLFTTQADCNNYNIAGSLEGATLVPYTGGSGTCAVTAATTGSPASAISVTCNYNSITVSSYNVGSCAGTPASTGTLNSNYACGSVSAGVYISGYSYYTCYTAGQMGVALTTMAPTADTSSCFAGSETVELANGEVKSIADVRIGDSVLAYSATLKETIFSDVIATPHARNEIKADFQHIVTENGSDIKLTAEHLLPAGSCSLPSLRLVQAKNVNVGECVQTVSGYEVVASNSVVKSEGIYTVVTQDADFVVVNNFVASPFAVNHAVGNAVYSIHRFVYALAPELIGSIAFGVVNIVATNLAAYFSK